MGCLCARGREYPDSKKEDKHQTMEVHPVGTTSVVIASRNKKNPVKLQLGLPVDTGSAASTPRRIRSNPQTPRGGKLLRLSTDLDPSSGGSSARRRSNANWSDVSLGVKLRDFRMIFGELETAFQLTDVKIGNLTKALYRITMKKCWIQTYDLTQAMGSKEMKRRLMMLKSLDHPNILKILSLLQDGSHLYAVYEATEGRTAEELIVDTGGISERWAAAIMRQVLAALRHCHSKGLTIKSLSLQHLHFAESPTEECTSVQLLISLEDYSEDALQESTGQDKCLLSCGMMLSTLVTGKVILNKQHKAVISKQLTSAYDKWQGVSEGAKSFTSALMGKNTRKRSALEQCLQHHWIAALQKPTLTHSLRKALRNLTKLQPTTSFKKALTQFMLNFVLSSEDLKEVRQAFKELDTNLEGIVSEEELRAQVFRLFPQEQAHATLATISSITTLSAGQSLSYSEFLMWACSRRTLTSTSNIIAAFQLLDQDKDGAVTPTDLGEFFCLESEGGDTFAWQMLISIISNNSQGRFFYEDFLNFMLKR